MGGGGGGGDCARSDCWIRESDESIDELETCAERQRTPREFHKRPASSPGRRHRVSSRYPLSSFDRLR